MAKKKEAVMELPVQFGTVSNNGKSISISCTASRPTLTPAKADANLCERRIDAELVARAGDGDADQPSFTQADNDARFNGVFDCDSFTVKKKAISFTISFKTEDVDIDTINHFAKRSGMIYMYEIVDAPDEPKPPKKKKAEEGNGGEG